MRNLQISTHGNKSRICRLWKHYRILLWKDYLLRRRGFWLIVAESFFVLIFVVAIAFIRRRHAIDTKSSCFFQSQSMSSMGLLNYIQSLICNFNYTCNEKDPRSFVTLNGLAPMIYFLDNLTHIADDPVFNKWLNEPDIFETEEFIDWISLGLKLTRLKNSANHLSIWINDYLLIYKNSSTTQSLEYMSQFICGSPANENDLGRFFIALKENNMEQDTSKSSSNNNNNNIPIVDHLRSQFNNLFDLSNADKLFTEKSLPHLNLCPIIKHLLNSKPFLITMGRLRYFLFGTIAYYPSNQFTDEIIYNMGKYTRLLNNFRQLINHYSNELRPWLLNLLLRNHNNNNINNQTNLIKFKNQLKQCKENKFGIIPNEIQLLCNYFFNFLQQNNNKKINNNNINNNDYFNWKLIINIIDFFINLLYDLFNNCIQIDQKFIPFHNYNDFYNYMIKQQNNLLSSPIGIIFNQIPNYLNHTTTTDITTNNSSMLDQIINSPNILSITLRNNPLFIYETNNINHYIRSKLSIPMPNRDPQNDMKYFTSGFIDIQEQLIQSFLYITSSKFNITNIYNQLLHNIGIEMKMFPTGSYYFDSLLVNIIFLLPQLMILCWIISIILTVKYMIDEKDNRLIDYLSIFGIDLSMNWLAWITISFILMSILSLIIVFILKYCNIIPLSNIILIYFILLNYIISCLIYCILFTLLKVRSTIASILSGIIYFLLFMPASVLLRYNELPNDLSLLPFCIIPQVSYSLIWIFINRLELQGTGVQWSNIWYRDNLNSILSLGTSLIFLWIGTILLCILTFWGIPFIIKYYHILMYKLEKNCIFNQSTTSINGMNKKKRKKRKISSGGNQLDISVNTSQLLLVNSFQTERQNLLNSTNNHYPIMLSPSVIVNNLTKIYQPSKRIALCNVNMNFYEDQITVILGRNGAGKTTLLSILVGILQPTQGKIIMHGEVTNKRLDVLRNVLGYCPQYDILYDTLTVAEHIHLFGTLKGMSRISINQKLDDYLHKLGLIDKRNEKTSTLSGGQRRKLSLFLAFLGNSSVILLDEPTASLDPFSRRAVWDLLKILRKGRTIILSSHHMYESDLLADQISILSEGKVLCSGSSLSLKSAYGSGYHLSLEIDPSNLNTTSDHNDNTMKLLKVIQLHVNDANLLNHNLSKLIIHLPTSDALNGKFTTLFQQLDNNEFQQLYHIKHYEITNSSLEDVFLTITNDNHKTMINNSNDYNHTTHNTTNNDNIEDYDDDPIEYNHHHHYLKKKPSLINMMKAMAYKRYIHLKRNKLSWFIEFIFPCLLLLIGIGFLEYFKPINIQPKMDIHHWIMKTTHTRNGFVHFYTTNNSNIHEGEEEEKYSFQSYLNTINNPFSLTGIGCISSALYKFQPKINSDCLIQTNGQFNLNNHDYNKHCELYSFNNKYPCYPLATNDILLNLSNIDISNYLLNHSKLLFKSMYGGIELKFNEKYQLNNQLYNLLYKLTNYSIELKQSKLWQQFLNNDLNLILPPLKIIRIWYDNRGYITPVAYLNLLHNYQYRLLLSNSMIKLNKQSHLTLNNDYHSSMISPTNSGIIVATHPLPYTDTIEYNKINDDIKADYLLSLFLILALSFIPASFISLPVYERNNNSKHLQLLSGLLPSIYWFINYLYDYVTYLLSSTLCIIIIIIHGNSAYIHTDTIYPFILTIYLYGLAMISLIYLASFLFKSSSTAFVLMCGLNLVISVMTTFVRFFLEILTMDSLNYQTSSSSSASSTTTTSQFINIWLRISPHYCLSGSFFTIALRDFFHKLGIPYKDNISLWNILKIDMGCLLLHSILLFIIVLLLEKQFYIIQIIHWKRNKFKWWNGVGNTHVGIHYTDLESNIQKIEDSSLKPKYAINVKSVCKHYWSQKKPTVDQLNLTIQSGECYGLLGVNGAGKSTIYSMLTGYCTITHGHIYLNGYDITLNKEKACENIGYCPQQDALCEFMTPKELLTFYSYLKYPHHYNHTNQVNKMIQFIGLQSYSDCIIGTLSGGNKRKLSTGIAFIGKPSIILLDEPSNGMDIQGKQLLWNNIKQAMKLNCTILLSSHYMEECELLCNHIGLLINGQIRCHGSPLELKQKYGIGYYMNIQFNTNILNYTNNLHTIMNNYLPNFQLRYPLLTRQEYYYNNNNHNKQPLWKLFHGLNELNKYNIIDSISIRHSTLEDVFVNYIKMYENNQLPSN
uniref:ATP-binding cassette sub-family A member 1 n=1 Tax=Schistosoma mansoni TaxID=6183 RepID=A0A5K4FBX6_SCHMA